MALRTLTRLVLATGLILAGIAPSLAEDAITEVVSPGGIHAWLRQDNSIPLVAVEFRFTGGSIAVPAEKAGAASMAAAMLGEGAGDRDAEAFRQVLADNSINLDFDADREAFSGSVVTLTENHELAADLVRDALMQPQMDAGAFARVKDGMIKAARARQQDPDSIAYRTWREFAFAGHPYAIGTEGTEETLAAVQPADLRAFLDTVLSRKSLIVGVAGDITPEQLGPLLDRMFGELPDREPPPAAPPLPDMPAGVSVVQFPTPQSVIVFGQRGIKRDDPDWEAASIVTQILGGGALTSRLGMEVREKRGLAYGIGIGLNPYPAGGLILGRTGTRNEAAAETLQVIEHEWQRMAAEGPTDEEVAEAKAYLIGSFPLSLDSTSAIASVLVVMQVYDLGIDYWSARPALYEAVTPEDVQRIARRLLDADSLLTVVVGQPQGVTSSF